MVGLANAMLKVRYPMTLELDTHPLANKFFGQRAEAAVDASEATS